VIKTPDKFSLSGSARNNWISRCLQEQFSLCARILVTKVPQELQEPGVPWQVAFTEATKHPEVRLEQGKQALRPVFVDVPTFHRITW